MSQWRRLIACGQAKTPVPEPQAISLRHECVRCSKRLGPCGLGGGWVQRCAELAKGGLYRCPIVLFEIGPGCIDILFVEVRFRGEVTREFRGWVEIERLVREDSCRGKFARQQRAI